MLKRSAGHGGECEPAARGLGHTVTLCTAAPGQACFPARRGQQGAGMGSFILLGGRKQRHRVGNIFRTRKENRTESTAG